MVCAGLRWFALVGAGWRWLARGWAVGAHRYNWMMIFPRLAVAAAFACLALAGCSTVRSVTEPLKNPVDALGGIITPYKLEVIQGNFVSKEQIEALQKGMSREQASAVLGTPLIASVFHADRWDYHFTLARQGVPAQARKFTVFFAGGVVERFEGDVMPSEREFVASLTSSRRFAAVPLLEAPEETLRAAAAAKPALASAALPDNPVPTKSAGTYPALERAGQRYSSWDAAALNAVNAADRAPAAPQRAASAPATPAR